MLHAFPTRPPRAFFVAVTIDPLGDRRSYRLGFVTENSSRWRSDQRQTRIRSLSGDDYRSSAVEFARKKRPHTPVPVIVETAVEKPVRPFLPYRSSNVIRRLEPLETVSSRSCHRWKVVRKSSYVDWNRRSMAENVPCDLRVSVASVRFRLVDSRRGSAFPFDQPRGIFIQAVYDRRRISFFPLPFSSSRSSRRIW